MPLVRRVIPSVIALLLCAVAGVAQAQSTKAVRPVRSAPLLQVAGAEQPIA